VSTSPSGHGALRHPVLLGRLDGLAASWDDREQSLESPLAALELREPLPLYVLVSQSLGGECRITPSSCSPVASLPSLVFITLSIFLTHIAQV